jgi:2-polyprenyl-3-methyl-5-hydroxy-6-metoxy-1,4-benzoquinol methylase
VRDAAPPTHTLSAPPPPISWLEYQKADPKSRLALDAMLIDKILKKKSLVCDLGSNPPILSYMLKCLGFKITSVDNSDKDWKSNKLKKELNLVILDLESKNFSKLLGIKKFNMVVLTEVFEHLRIDPIQLILEIRSILKTNGYLYLTTPNARRMPNLKSFFYDKENNCDLHLNYSHLRIKKFCGHYREFLPNELVIFFSKMGFKVVQLSTRTYNDNSDRSIINILRRIKIFVYNKFHPLKF